jgi:hypothetical protein
MTQSSARVVLSTFLMSIAVLAAAGCAATSSSPAPSAGGATTGHATGSPSAGGGSAGSLPTAGQGPVPTLPAGGPAPVGGGTACADWPSGVPEGNLPLTFTPVTALRCVTGERQIAGKGPVFAATLQRADGNLAALAQALRTPSEAKRPGMMCPMLAMVPPQVVLVAQDGSMLRPKFPVTSCDLILPSAMRALNALPWRDVSVRVFSQAPGSGASPGPTSDPQASDLVPGSVKKGVVRPGGPSGPAR